MSADPQTPVARRRTAARLTGGALLLAALATVALLSLRAPKVVLTAEERAWLNAHGPLRFAPDPSFAPIEWIDEQGNHRGLVADFFVLIQERLAIRIEIVRARDWGEVLEKAKAFEIDGVPAAQPTPERSAFLRWSPPFFELPHWIIVRQGEAGTPTLASLAGRRLTLTAGSSMEKQVRTEHPGVLISLVPDDIAGLSEVSFGHADAALVNLAVATYLIQHQGFSNLRLASAYGSSIQMAIGTRSDEPLLASIMAKGLAAVSAPEREAIQQRWIRLDVTGVRVGRTLLIALAAAAALAALVAIVVLGWNAALRRQVAAATAGLQAEMAERRRTEEALARAQRLESLSVLAGGIAHDFNNLLTGIVGNLSLAQEEPGATGEVPALLKEAEDAAWRAQALTRQLLTFSKGGAPVTEVVELLPLVQESATFAVRGRSTACRFSAAPGLWPAAVDPGQVGQVVQNLVINAAEAMPSGGIIEIDLENVQLEATGLGRLPPGPYVRLRVRDHGSGIPAEVLPAIFDPFVSTKQRGSGLGLAVCHSVVARHGGAIDVRSALGQGTTFEVLLPAAPAAVVAGSVAGVPTPRQRGRVLVMDDEEMLRRLAQRIIGSLGCEVAVAADGQEAVALWRAARESGRPFDLVVVDLTVPGGIGGTETLQRLRALDPAVRVVVSSGYSEAAELSGHAGHGFTAVLPKPYSLEQVRRVIGGLLGPAA